MSADTKKLADLLAASQRVHLPQPASVRLDERGARFEFSDSRHVATWAEWLNVSTATHQVAEHVGWVEVFFDAKVEGSLRVLGVAVLTPVAPKLSVVGS